MEWIEERQSLDRSSVEGFHVLLTIDKNLAHQQTLNDKEIAVVVLGAAKSKIDLLLPLLRTFKDHVDQFENGKAYLIE